MNSSEQKKIGVAVNRGAVSVVHATEALRCQNKVRHSKFTSKTLNENIMSARLKFIVELLSLPLLTPSIANFSPTTPPLAVNRVCDGNSESVVVLIGHSNTNEIKTPKLALLVTR